MLISPSVIAEENNVTHTKSPTNYRFHELFLYSNMGSFHENSIILNGAQLREGYN
jgi:hypothetical protein